ncbi:MAG: TIGR00153 family protein [Phycisphaeraceae bacterium]
MRSIAKLFSRSPFVPLQVHVDKVTDCVHKTRELVETFLAGSDSAQVERLAEEISALEHAADDVKHDIQNQLPRGLFLAVDRTRLLEIVGIQDNIADKAENLGALLTLKPHLTAPPGFEEQLRAFLEKNIAAFDQVRQIVHELDDLLETSFGGAEAERVVELVQHVAELEHEADRMQHDMLKNLFTHEDQLTHGEFYLWTRILRQISELSNLSERLANRIRTLLIVK